jgi:DNA-binding MarR family transcriptional regulator
MQRVERKDNKYRNFIISGELSANLSLNWYEKIILAFILKFKKPIYYLDQKMISNALGLDVKTVGNNLKRLEAKNYIEYIEVPEKRYKKIVICERAEKFRARSEPYVYNKAEDIVSTEYVDVKGMFNQIYKKGGNEKQ